MKRSIPLRVVVISGVLMIAIMGGVACGISVTGQADGDGASSSSGGSTGSLPDGAPATADGATGSSGSSGGASDGSSANDAGDSGFTPADGGPLLLSASCSDLIAKNPQTIGQSGYYEMHVASLPTNPAFTVYCENSIDKGGWTLVGRSAPNANNATAFGWSAITGTVQDFTKPYSLGVVLTGLSNFQEIMIGDHPPTTTNVATRAYKMKVPANFYATYGTTVVATSNRVTVKGDCNPADDKTMWKYAGQTALLDGFFLRDINDPNQHRGVKVDELDFADYNNCDQGGYLDSTLGLIFVR